MQDRGWNYLEGPGQLGRTAAAKFCLSLAGICSRSYRS